MQKKLTEKMLGLHDDTVQPWNLDRAKKIAAGEQIELTDAHLDVIQYLRVMFENHGPIKHARTLTQAMDARFAKQGGLKYLYQLFPGGPVTQGCRIAGVPLPADSTDKSFGTSV